MNAPASIASSPRRIRQSNEVAALSALHRGGRLSRAELARTLRLNRSSSGHIVAGLTADGLVREVGDDPAARGSHSRAGRPGIMLELVPDAVFFLGVEIGVEHISVVEVDLTGRIVSSASEAFDGPSSGVDEAVERALALAIGSMPRERLERCEGFGIATPSHMDRNGTIRLAPLLGWRDVPLADLVRARLPVQAPVLAENDANALAIGATYGLGDAHSGVTLFLVMESGVGGGIVIDGRLFRGANGLAGEIGHLQMQPGGDAPRTLEQLIGLEPLLSEYGRICGHGHPSLAGLLAAVRAGEPMALGIAQSWARFLAHALIQACRIIDADRIVLGGSVAALYPHVAEHVAEHFRTMQEPGFPIPSIALHENSAVGSAYGAACMLHQRYLSLDSHRFVEDEGAGRAGVSDHE